MRTVITSTLFALAVGCGGTATGTDPSLPADTTAPILSGAQPSGTLAGGTTQETLRVTTNEAATCKWSATSGTAYAAMTSTFTTTGTTSHNTVVTGLTDGQTYTCYVRCQDAAGNATTSDYVVTFDISTVAGPIAVSLVASRASGVAPLSVFFDATGTTDTAMTSQPFHDLEYRWDFRDPAGGATWAYGAQAGVSSKNLATGPVAAHVFETPGTYTIALSVFDGSNTATSETTVTVDDPDVVFSGANTICIAATSTPVQGQDGCPAGASTAQQASFPVAIGSYAGTGKRVLFKHDDTFGGTAIASIAVQGPGTIGMYGIGAKPKVQSTASNVIQLGSPTAYAMQDWRIMDLELDGQSNPGVSGFGVNGNADQITLLRMNIHDIGDGVSLDGAVLEWYMSTNGYAEHVFDQFTLVDSTIAKIVGGASHYGLYVFANHLALLGNYVNDTSAGSHVARIMHSAPGMVSNNTFANPALTRQVFTLRAPSYTDTGICCEYYPHLLPGEAALTTRTVVVENKFVGGLSNQPVTVTPSNRAEWDGRFKDILFECNWYTGASSECCWPMLMIQAQDVTVRNEIIDMTGGGNHAGVYVLGAGANSIASNNVRLYSSTLFSNDAGDFTALGAATGATNTTVRNNLAYSPNVSATFDVTNTTASNNSTSTHTSPLMAHVPPATPADFKITAGSYAIGTGAVVPVWSDFFLVPQTSTRDMGAVIH